MAVNTQQLIAGLYVAFFQRGPDLNGLNFWLDEAKNLNLQDQALAQKISQGFSQHPSFTSIYGNLGNSAFIDQIYINIGGAPADTAGKNFWLNAIENSNKSRADFVGDFVFLVLNISVAELQQQRDSGSITQKEFDDAILRQDRLTNKSQVGILFTEKLGQASNLSTATNPNDPASLEMDDAFRASQIIIKNVTEDDATLSGPTTYLNGTPTIPEILGLFSSTGTPGNDSIPGSSNSDVINGDAGNDTINGGGGDDTINGGIGDDSINAGTGNDAINGGPGNDIITGGEGADTFTFGATAIDNGVDQILDFQGGTGGDVMNFTAFLGTATVKYDAPLLTVTSGGGGLLGDLLGTLTTTLTDADAAPQDDMDAALSQGGVLSTVGRGVTGLLGNITGSLLNTTVNNLVSDLTATNFANGTIATLKVLATETTDGSTVTEGFIGTQFGGTTGVFAVPEVGEKYVLLASVEADATNAATLPNGAPVHIFYVEYDATAANNAKVTLVGTANLGAGNDVDNFVAANFA